MRPYINMTDDELTAEITATFAARKTAIGGGVAVVAGEGRRIEYTRSNLSGLDRTLRDLGFEARKRGLPIGGIGGAIAVEIG
ncbi:MAG: hypothetical protein ABW128_06845 [Rhizorhabdus sp.]